MCQTNLNEVIKTSRVITLGDLRVATQIAKDKLWAEAGRLGRRPKIYLHWTAGRYDALFSDYHVCISQDDDGAHINLMCEDLSNVLAHTWRRNSGAIGLTLCCALDATPDDLGDYPPTPEQIEIMAQCIAIIADTLHIPIDRYHVLTHGEAADNMDGLLPEGDEYGPCNGCERWDLQYLGTDESPEYTTDYDDPATGGNVLRGKANWYLNEWK